MKKNRVRNVQATQSGVFYSVDVIADMSAISPAGMIPENIEIYQNDELIHTDTFRIIASNRAEIVEIVRADAEKIANRANESHIYIDSAGSLIVLKL